MFKIIKADLENKDIDIAVGVNTTASTISNWQNSKSIPRDKDIKKISKYFFKELEYKYGNIETFIDKYILEAKDIISKNHMEEIEKLKRLNNNSKIICIILTLLCEEDRNNRKSTAEDFQTIDIADNNNNKVFVSKVRSIAIIILVLGIITIILNLANDINKKNFGNVNLFNSVKATPSISNKTVKETGLFFPDRKLGVYKQPSLSGYEEKDHYSPGERILYDSKLFTSGYVWISYISYRGTRSYVPIRTYNNGKEGSLWGSFDKYNYVIAKGELNYKDKYFWTLISDRNTFIPNKLLPARYVPHESMQIEIWCDPNEKIYYDSKVLTNGYVWISYISKDGMRLYVPIRTYKNSKEGTIWGEILQKQKDN